MRLLVLALALSSVTTPATAAAQPKHMCGWLINETPGNFELIDRQGTWTIAEQGGYQAEGVDRLPDLPPRDWVQTNGPHGHGCACVTATVDHRGMRVVGVLSAVPVALGRCRGDHRLAKP